MKKAWIWVILLLLIGGGIGGFLWLRNNQTPSEDNNILRTAEVFRGDLDITVAASGNVSSNEKSDLRFKSTGKVAHVNVEAGDRVEAGQELARLDTDDLERAVRQAEIALEQAELNLDIATQTVDEEELALAELAVQNAAQALEVARIGRQTAQADANNLKVQAQRARENAHINLSDAKGTPSEENAEKAYRNALEQEAIAKINAELLIEQAQDQWDNAYKQYQQAKVNLAKLEEGPDEEQIQLSELQVEQAKLNLEQAQENLANAVVIAPITGIVANVNIQEGVLAPASVPAITLVDDSRFFVDVTVDEIDIGKIVVGQPVDVTLDAAPDTTLIGRVESISPTPTNIAGLISYSLQVALTESNGAEVRDGMTASVRIRTSKLENVLLVPNWAVRTDQSSSDTYTYCYCIQEDVPKRVEVTPGKRNETYTEITEGLEEGAQVALVIEERELIFEGPPSQGR